MGAAWATYTNTRQGWTSRRGTDTDKGTDMHMETDTDTDMHLDTDTDMSTDRQGQRQGGGWHSLGRNSVGTRDQIRLGKATI